LIHTADYEGCPNVVIEAMAYTRAVIATDAGDIPYLVEHGKTALWCLVAMT
jgi:glycosyltransferase involved in cell wall biosynthesis